MASKQFLVPGNHATVRGIVAPGATATLYTTGTTTPQAFYSDESRLVSLGSTITADAIGNFPIAYQDETVPFRLILKDRLGTELGDIDPFYFGVTTLSLPAAANSYAARSDMAAVSAEAGSMAYLREAGREGTFVFDTSNLATLVTADTAQGIYVAPSSDTTGASGAWVRKFSGPAESTWFGVSTSATAAANVTAFTAALALLNALKVDGYGYNDGSIGLHTPAGLYTFNNTISIAHALEITGDFTRNGSGGGTVFEWTSNTHGFQALSPTCYGATIKGLVLKGTNGGTAKHAINQTGNLAVENCYLYNWSGNGINADSTSGGLSGSTYRNILGEAVGWTLYLQGPDSNGCTIINVGATAVRFGGIFDSSGIGNVIVGGVINSCGVVSGYATRCVYSGKGYAVAYGQEAGASTNAPSGTTANNTYWIYDSGLPTVASATAPAWASGLTWYFSAPICSEPADGNVRTTVVGAYIESGLNPIVLSDPSTMFGGQVQVAVYNGAYFRHGGFIRGASGYMLANSAIRTLGPYANDFQNSASSFGPSTNPGVSQDQTLTFYSWNSYNILNFYVGGVSQGAITNYNSGIIHDFDTTNWRTKAGAGGTALATLDTTGYNLTSGGYKVAGTTAIDSSRNGNFGTVTATGLVSTPASASGGAGLTLPHGAAPTSPVNGNVWTTTGGIFWRINGATVQVATGGGTAIGTNTGDQTITLTSDVTGSGTGSFATTIAANAVTYAKFQQVAASSLVGNPTGSLANAQGITLAGGLAFSGTTLTAAGALTPTSVASTGAVTSSSASAGIGYATGAGGTVTQITSKATGVTLNKICGQITMNGAALAAGAKVSFAVSNTSCAATDIPQVAVVSGGTANAYRANVTAVAANSFTVTVENITAGSLSEAPVIGFFINKAVTA